MEYILTQEKVSLDKMSTLTISIGIMAYNEAENIGHLLQSLVDNQPSYYSIAEIIVVASGCTDNTEAIVRDFMVRNPLVRLLVQENREGKASAINLFMKNAQSDILVMESADTIPEPETIRFLLEPFKNAEIGMTGGHPIPTNDPDTFLGYAVHLMWELHHQIALNSPKLGEIIAFRRVFNRIPISSAVDEVSIEAIIRCQGYELMYVPNAIVHNHGPETVSDFLRQRRRIYAGHLNVQRKLGYEVSTMSVLTILGTLLASWRGNWRQFFWLPGVISLEMVGRFLGWMDILRRNRDHAIWEVCSSTKKVIR